MKWQRRNAGYRLRLGMLVLLLLITGVLTACQIRDDGELLLDHDGLTRKLTIEFVSFRDGADKLLHEKIRRFDEERRDIKVEIRDRFKTDELGFTPWLLDKKGTGDPPDLIELTPNQMKLAFHHGKLETFNRMISDYGI